MYYLMEPKTYLFICDWFACVYMQQQSAIKLTEV